MLEWVRGWPGLCAAGLGAAGAVATSGAHIGQHLRNYHEPVVQRYTCRVVLMVPIYGIDSFISIAARNPGATFVVTTLRDCYEAYTLFNFLCLTLAYVGGASALVHLWAADERKLPTSWFWSTCCLGRVPLDSRFLRRVMQGAIQFIIVKLALAAISLVLEFTGDYHDGQFRVDGGYGYLVLVYNVSIFVALYALLVYYHAAEPYLAPYKPVLKFVLVKVIIFLTFWQSVAVALLYHFRVLEPMQGLDAARSSVVLQSFLICLEALPLAVLNSFGFPPIRRCITKTNPWKALRHFVRVHDVYIDATTNLDSRYQEFVSLGHHNVDAEASTPQPGEEDGKTVLVGRWGRMVAVDPLSPLARSGAPGGEGGPPSLPKPAG